MEHKEHSMKYLKVLCERGKMFAIIFHFAIFHTKCEETKSFVETMMYELKSETLSTSVESLETMTQKKTRKQKP